MPTASARLLRGGQNFEITLPQAHNPFNINAAGLREMHVTFTPRAVGEYWDVVEITDTANPANKTGILLKGKVTVTGE